LANRTIFIKLFLDIEDANKRKFTRPNLHNWIFANRDEILSALYSLVRNWFDVGSPAGAAPFASFPEWARICGGVMEAAGYGTPCKRDENRSGISIDYETDEMKELFERCYKEHPNILITKEQIKEIVIANGIMTNLDWGNRSDQTKFGNKLITFKNRILSNIRIRVEDDSIRPSRWKYIFSRLNEGEVKKWTF